LILLDLWVAVQAWWRDTERNVHCNSAVAPTQRWHNSAQKLKSRWWTLHWPEVLAQIWRCKSTCRRL